MHGDEYQKDSQQEPNQDSALQTPQPDQPHPPVSNRRDDSAQDSEPIHVEVEADGPIDVSVDNPVAPGHIDGDAISSD